MSTHYACDRCGLMGSSRHVVKIEAAEYTVRTKPIIKDLCQECVKWLKEELNVTDK